MSNFMIFVECEEGKRIEKERGERIICVKGRDEGGWDGMMRIGEGGREGGG